MYLPIQMACVTTCLQQNCQHSSEVNTPRLFFISVVFSQPLSLFPPLRSPEGVDSQPPALPPKQLSRKTLNEIIQAHSQQSLLDNHLNEMYDVPVNTDKTTVSMATRNGAAA